MSRKTSIPCYVNNGGVHNIVNIPFGQFTRAALKSFVNELLQSAQQFETMFICKVTDRNLQILKALAEILSFNLKPKENRRKAKLLTTVHEKNLKPSALQTGNEEEINLVSLSLSLGLITLLFLIAAHIEYLEALNR